MAYLKACDMASKLVLFTYQIRDVVESIESFKHGYFTSMP